VNRDRKKILWKKNYAALGGRRRSWPTKPTQANTAVINTEADLLCDSLTVFMIFSKVI
jgi:hypothetical protein